MSFVTTTIFLMLLFAFAIMAGRAVGRQKNLISAMATGGAILVALSIAVIVSLHCLDIPITTGSLFAIYFATAALLIIAHLTTCRRMPWVITSDITKIVLPGFVLFAFMILPFTHFTGIDTYKWQDLATAINLEQNVPWLVHPLSLLGFTPRSYPSAQPILLATIQILGNRGVDAGFAILSLFIAALGCASAYLFGIRAFRTPRHAAIYALLYIYTPVFTRYTHWATGRGLFMALFPLLLATLIGGRKSEVRGRKRPMLHVLCAVPLLLLLALSHKVGFIIALSYIPIYLSGLLAPKRSNRLMIIISILPVAVLALLVVPRSVLPFPFGNVLGIIRYSLTRFGLLMPMAIFGLIAYSNLLETIKWRRLFPLVLIAIPLAFERHMYGALIAAPLITLAATESIVWLMSNRRSGIGGRRSEARGRKSEVGSQKSEAGNKGIETTDQRRTDKGLKIAIFCTITIAFTIATIIHRSRIATPVPVYRAAQFLEQHDPTGPFVIYAPGRARTQIQAYVSGCPRFNLTTGTNSVIKISAPPTLKSPPHKLLQNWTNYMRGFMTVPELATDWYGKDPRKYYITIDDQGTHPPDAKQIYNKTGVKIYTP